MPHKLNLARHASRIISDYPTCGDVFAQHTEIVRVRSNPNNNTIAGCLCTSKHHHDPTISEHDVRPTGQHHNSSIVIPSSRIVRPHPMRFCVRTAWEYLSWPSTLFLHSHVADLWQHCCHSCHLPLPDRWLQTARKTPPTTPSKQVV